MQKAKTSAGFDGCLLTITKPMMKLLQNTWQSEK